MPAFTFEKISPPHDSHRSFTQQSQARPQNGPREPRGSVIQVLGRFVEARVCEDERLTGAPPPRKSLPK
jgi:hypothetical protein